MIRHFSYHPRPQLDDDADLIWTAEMERAAAADPRRLRELLLQASVPEAAVELLLQQVSEAVAESVPVVVEAIQPTTPEREAPAAVDGEQLLLRLIGPIGSTVWQEVAHLPAEQRLVALETTLRGYGLDTLTLADLRRQLQGG